MGKGRKRPETSEQLTLPLGESVDAQPPKQAKPGALVPDVGNPADGSSPAEHASAEPDVVSHVGPVAEEDDEGASSGMMASAPDARLREGWHKLGREVLADMCQRKTVNQGSVGRARTRLDKPGTSTGGQGASPPALHLAAQQVRAFYRDSLPLLMELARFTKGVLKSRLSRLPTQWSYEDRVLALLAPSLVPDIHRYYESGGPDMANLFEPHQLAHMDRDLVSDLGKHLERVHPGINRVLRKLGTPDDEPE